RAIYDRLLELEPGSIDVMSQLDDLLHELGQEAERIPLLEEMANNARSIEEKRSTQVHIGELCHSTGDLEGAVRAYRFVLDRRPEENSLDEMAEKAGERLIGLYDTLGRTRQVMDLRLLMGRTSPDPETTRAHLLTAGILAHDEAADLDKAALIFDELLNLDENDVAALDWAKRTARERGDSDRLMDLVQSELKQAGDDDSRVASLMEMAAIHAEQGDERVLEPLRTVLEMEPGHAEAREMVGGYLESDSLALDSALLLEAAAERSGDDDLRARALTVQVQLAEPGDARTGLRIKLADCLLKLERGDEAVDVLSQGFLEAPESETVFKALVERLEAADRLAELSKFAAKAAENVVGPGLAVRLGAAAVLVRGGLHDEAVELLEANCVEDDGHLPTLELLENAYTNLERPDGVLRTLDRIAAATPDAKAQSDVYMKCAGLAMERLDDVAGAKDYFGKVLELFPLHDEAIPGLTEILEKEGDREGLRRLRKNELSNLEGHDSVGDLLRVATLRRRLALAALEDGDFEEAASMAIALVEAKQPEPDDLATARRVYAEAGNPPALFHALADAYERTVERDGLLDLHRFASSLDIEDPDRRSALLAAVELEETLEREEWLFEDLGALFLMDPEDAALRERFESAGRRIDRISEVKDLLVEAFGRHQDEPVTFDLATAIARLLRDELDSEDEAVEYLRVAFLRRPEDRGTVEALATLYEKLSRFGDLALLYENLGDMEEDGEKRVALYFKAFDVIRNLVKDPVSAVETLKKILDQDPTSGTALDALEAIARETNDPQTLAQSLASKAEVAADEADRVVFLQELAEVQDGQLSQADAAIDTLTTVLDLDPTCAKARRHLEELYVRTQKYAELADLYEQNAELESGPDEKTEALKKASAVHETYLEDMPMAISLLRRVLDIDPHNDYAFSRLTEMLEREDDNNALAELLVSRLELADAVSEQVELNVRIGKVLADKKEDFAGAVIHLKAALNLDPYHDEARTIMEKLLNRASVAMDVALALETVYEASGEHIKLCDVLRRETSMVETAPERETLLLRIAQVQVERLDDPVHGLETLGEALAECPSNTDTLAMMEEVAGKSNQHESFYAILNERLNDDLDADVRSRLQFKAAVLADTRLKRPEKAAEHYAAFLEDNEGHAETLAALDRIYTEMGRSGDLAEVLRKRIGQGGDATEIELRRRLAELLSGRLDDAEGALDQLRQVLDLNPGDKEAIRQLSNLTDHPVSGALALDLLTTSLRDAEDDEGLLWAIEAQIQRGEEDTDMTSLHAEAATIAGRLGKPKEQVAHLGKALYMIPSNETFLASLVSVAKDEGLQSDAWELLSAAADAATWDDLEKSLRLHAGLMARDAGALEDEMEKSLLRVLEIDPMCKDAIDVLAKYYDENGRAGDLVGILERRLKLDMSQTTRVSTLNRIADLCLMRNEEKRAAEALEEASGIDPSDIETLRRLREVYEKSGDTAGMVSAIERLAAVSTDPDEKIHSLLDAAGLQAGKLKDKVAARNTLEILFGVDPGNVVGRGKLQDLYEELGEWEPLMAMLAQISENDDDPGVRVEAALKAASVAETHLDDLAVAASHIEKAREIEPDNSAVLDEAIRLYYRLEDWTSLVEMLRLKANTTSAEPEKVALLAKACDIAQTRMGDPDLAGRMAREVLSIDDTNAKALLVTARLMEAKEEHEEALDLFRRLSKATGDMEERAQALLGVARILMARGDDGDEARESLQAAQRIKPDHPEVNRYLKDLYSGSGDYEALIDVMQRNLKQAPDDVTRSSICMDIAEIYLSRLNDGAKFLEWADEALRFKGDDPRVVEGIVDFHLKSGEVRKAVPHLEWLVNYLEGKRRLKELPPYAYQLGRILEGSGELDKAIQYYRLCHDHDAADIPNALALGRLYMSREEHEKALRIYQPLMVRIDSLEPSGRGEVLLALATISAARGDRKKARQYVLRVLAEEPDNVEAQALLSKGL
ncbi:MAG: hypothetical protein GXP54_06015, partial [Deltaproteobacteria bacterium]|nr:hypothetical protein [Deltaproteobacteria bacterium]